MKQKKVELKKWKQRNVWFNNNGKRFQYYNSIMYWKIILKIGKGRRIICQLDLMDIYRIVPLKSSRIQIIPLCTHSIFLDRVDAVHKVSLNVFLFFPFLAVPCSLWDISVPQPGSEDKPRYWKYQTPTSRWPGKSNTPKRFEIIQSMFSDNGMK